MRPRTPTTTVSTVSRVPKRLRLPLLLVSIVMALAVKIAVHEGEQLSTQTLPILVQNQLPPGFVVMQGVNQVQVQLRGKSSDMAQLNPLTMHVNAEISVTDSDFVEVVLQSDDVIVPSGLEVLSIQPHQFTVEVDREVTRRLPIRVQPSGEPAAGAQVAAYEARPQLLEVIGPAKLVRNIDELVAPISVDRRAIDFEVEITPTLPDPTIRYTQRSRVVIQVSFVEPELSTLDDIPGDVDDNPGDDRNVGAGGQR